MFSLKTSSFRMSKAILRKSSHRVINRGVTSNTSIPNMESAEFDYEKAICKLNSLQSNVVTIENIKERIRRREDCVNIKEIMKYLDRVGICSKEMGEISVIHVAGTKGKGSTCAMCEAILRRHGYRTGLYSSPHLVSVTERIRLDGKPLSKEAFARSFSQVYNQLYEKRSNNNDIPGYFMFLTVLALKIFHQEKVDVAIVEVGIGGEYDVTNVVSNVAAAGITSLGLEHTAILGDTIEMIAAEKGGIMKAGCRAFTVPTQPPSAMKVLERIARERNCALTVVPELSSYKWETNKEPTLLADIPAFKLNASLAIKLSEAWMRKHKAEYTIDTRIYDSILQTNRYSDKTVVDRNVSSNRVPLDTCKGISSCVLPGRCQILKKDLIDFYIDGAHTLESIRVCVDWFKSQLRPSCKRILIFNTTGDRNSKSLLRLLHPLDFHLALFVPNVAFDHVADACVDQLDLMTNDSEVLQRCQENLDIWKRLNLDELCQVSNGIKSESTILPSVHRAVEDITRLWGSEEEKPQVVITGSLHLVGAALTVLDPELKTFQ